MKGGMYDDYINNFSSYFIGSNSGWNSTAFSGGISLLFTFGDVIIAGLIIYAIVKHIYKNHHKN